MLLTCEEGQEEWGLEGMGERGETKWTRELAGAGECGVQNRCRNAQTSSSEMRGKMEGR